MNFFYLYSIFFNSYFIHRYRFDDKKQVLDEDCEECQITTHDPKLKNLFICLHALRYKVIIKYLTIFNKIILIKTKSICREMIGNMSHQCLYGLKMTGIMI